MQKKLFSELGLSVELLKAVEKVGYEEASPIQSQAIPVLLEGSDVVGQSQTGSGKTAAFAIPAIEKVDPTLRATQALILCPTRELAVQVAEEVAKLAHFKRGVRELPIYGGASYERQFRGLKDGAHIVIGTPGRVMDHLKRRTLDLTQIKMIILDEADRMLDMGFLDDIRTILKEAPADRQTVFFSATMPRPIQDLIRTFTRNPVSVTIAAQTLTVPNIEQVYYEVDRRNKIEVLCRLIDWQDIKFGIIFCATKLMVDELTEHLKARGYQADKMHGDMTQGMREKVIGKFREKRLEFLVATDVAARGLDVDEIEVVFNYDLPQDGEDYVHRIGRTGRAGRSGKAITFVGGREIYKLENIMRFTKGRIRREKVPTPEEVEAKRSNEFFETLRDMLEQKSYERHDELVDRLLEQGHTPTDIASALIHLLIASNEPAPEPVREERPRYERGERSGRYQRPEHRDVRERGSRPEFDEHSPHEQGPKREPMVREEGMTRLTLGAGRDHKVQPGDILGLIVGVTKLPKENVGAIRLATKQSFVDVRDEHAETILKRLNGIDFKGRKLWAKRTA